MKCLVTGSAGFIGDALVKRLTKDGYKVTALLHKSKPKKQVKKAEYVYGDISEINSIKSYFKDIDFVLHCAAIVNDYGPKKKFFKINLEGTKNLVKLSEDYKVKKFIFLSHIRYEKGKRFSHYRVTKDLAEQYLLEKNKKNGFPVTIIRPGNVYGPGSTLWVLRILKSIKERKITLIDNGNGIFLHTYIDNLSDAIMEAIKEPKALGKSINITDGDNSITWSKYFNDLAKIANEPPVKRNLSKKTAFFISKLMIFLNKVLKITPWVTPTAVQILTNQHKVTIYEAKKILGYEPKITYNESMKQIEKWLKEEGYIS
jgi:nucleoside-diphosphate-sugar epimerase